MAVDGLRLTPRLLWNGARGLVGLALTVALTLVVALALGWNTPRPARSPDWEAADLPRELEATAHQTRISLLGCRCGDFTLEVQAIPLSDADFNGYGLVYRAQDPAHYYAFAVGGDAYYAILRVDGDEEAALVDWRQFPHVRRGRQANRLRVSCEGATCRFFVNDEYAVTVEDAAWLEGEVGLWARGFDDRVAVRFDSAHLWREGE